MTHAADVVAVAAKSATYNIILQVFVRIISFVSNAVLLRFITKDALGIINVRLMLLYSTTHCLSREAFRRSCLSGFEQSNSRKIINLLWMPVPISLITGLFLRFIWLHVLEVPSEDDVPYYTAGVNVAITSVIVEMLAEPLYIIGQNFNFVKLKVIVEGASHTFKSICMVSLVYKWPQSGIFVFCYAHILSSILYTSAYYTYFTLNLKFEQEKEQLPLKSISDILPKWSSAEFIDRKRLFLTWSFYKQTILKQLLTEGERYIMTFFKVLSFSEQGVYDVISNLGSMAARFIFLPIEDSSYILFSQLLKRGCQADKQQNPEACERVLQLLSKLMLLIGLTILVFGQSYSKLLLLIYGGHNFVSSLALALLKWHCIYIFFIAVNGITECFVFATMSSQEIDRYNQKMVVFSVVFLLMSYMFVTSYGSLGFLLANCVNMFCRIIHSLKYIKEFFSKTISWMLGTFLPHQCVLLTFGLCLALTSVSETYLFQSELWTLHVVFGTCCLVMLFFVTFHYEKSLVYFMIDLLSKRGSTEKKRN